MFGRRKVATVVAEFLGTGVLTLVFLSVLRSQLALGFFIAIAAAVALTAMTFAVGRLSGGYFNPALALGAFVTRQLSAMTTLLYMAAQFAGAALAYLLFTYLVDNKLPASKAEFDAQVLVAELTGTAIFAFGWCAALAYQNVSTAASAAMRGVSYMAGFLPASAVLGLAFLNPALALGARTWVWGSYVLGSLLGGIVGFVLYQTLFTAAEAETVAAPAEAAVTPARKTTKRPTKKTSRKK